MPVIKKLSLNSVRFGAGGRDTLPAATVEISQISLRHISDAALVAAIIQYASVPNSFLQITSCPLGSINFIVSAWDLHLEAIDARENMETFLSLWTGDTLSVTDSLCFDDRALLAIGQNLDLELRISNCRNISVDGLKKMVKKLKGDHADDFPEHRTVFENLHLSRQGFMLSPEEKDWFYDNGIGTVM
ncbi:hypothetical protein Hypma_013618 [Hypsizygus marmoreus]|uniref:F-box domain-containing protein n=1 Tax=Hypsizygus marmoreus TaxID=39966 RepID=A0A369JIV6_HYPMA|nr:hypothetical protein Hypma_013618 [Hypsizygus marmoreus]